MDELREWIKENMAVSVSVDRNADGDQRLSVALLIRNNDGSFGEISRSEDTVYEAG